MHPSALRLKTVEVLLNSHLPSTLTKMNRRSSQSAFLYVKRQRCSGDDITEVCLGPSVASLLKCGLVCIALVVLVWIGTDPTEMMKAFAALPSIWK